ncbi:hypothetical protein FA95DRAFT_744922 [Auriscalpium vulgare]|uniref:Uncharacterized protein n=1 Tax=Auriscalpium vulgare TaxID=40419 RepID=A0ACB8SB68_9AGAM|nr:hypothetical protein FA95DRAFT_744922 [Auriscalpium vulgare]
MWTPLLSSRHGPPSNCNYPPRSRHRLGLGTHVVPLGKRRRCLAPINVRAVRQRRMNAAHFPGLLVGAAFPLVRPRVRDFFRDVVSVLCCAILSQLGPRLCVPASVTHHRSHRPCPHMQHEASRRYRAT